jgi:hypothetical protein
MFVKYPWRFSSSEFSSQKIMKPSVLWFWNFLKNRNRYVLEKSQIIAHQHQGIFLRNFQDPQFKLLASLEVPYGSLKKSPCLWALVWPRNSLHYLRVDWKVSESGSHLKETGYQLTLFKIFYFHNILFINEEGLITSHFYDNSKWKYMI